MNKLFSIIIPVYKVEKYIIKCLQSLLDQTYHNFEAILVDDGSPDNSIAVAKELVGNDPRFMFLVKENGGQASARNLGLDYARGDYISFLDSDDYFKNEFLEKMLMMFNAYTDADVITCGYQQVEENGDVIKTFMPNVAEFYRKNDLLLVHEEIDYNVWNKVYRRSVWEGQRFVNGIIYEDKEILPRLLYDKKIYLLDEYLCCYVRRDGSTMNSFAREKSISSVLYIYREYSNFLKEKNIYQKYQNYYQKAYIKFCFFRQLYMILSFSNNYVSDCRYLMDHMDKNLVNLSNVKKYYGVTSKQFITFVLFKISPSLVKIVLKVKLKLMDMIRGKK